uniref:Uncharacterized protein n=1 Tax=Arundo donax TaxID=35708 RepID=A0A0A9EM55_ARUDO
MEYSDASEAKTLNYHRNNSIMQRESSRLEAAIEIQKNLLATAPTNSNLTSLSNQERRRLRQTRRNHWMENGMDTD